VCMDESLAPPGSRREPAPFMSIIRLLPVASSYGLSSPQRIRQ
jgi:hypothetical protein